MTPDPKLPHEISSCKRLCFAEVVSQMIIILRLKLFRFLFLDNSASLFAIFLTVSWWMHVLRSISFLFYILMLMWCNERGLYTEKVVNPMQLEFNFWWTLVICLILLLIIVIRQMRSSSLQIYARLFDEQNDSQIVRANNTNSCSLNNSPWTLYILNSEYSTFLISIRI